MAAYYVARIKCPWCNGDSRFQFEAQLVQGHPEGFEDVNLYRCGACGMPVFGDDSDDGPGRMIFLWTQPAGYASPDYDGTPEAIADAAREAYRCMGVNAPNAAATMARRAVQAAAIDLGAPRGRLVDQLKWLRDADRITGSLFEVGERLRLAGNDGAHPLDSVTLDDAHQLLAFLDALLLYVYGLSKKLKLAKGPPADN